VVPKPIQLSMPLRSANKDQLRLETQRQIKLWPRGARTCALPLFCDRDLETNPLTLKLEGDLDVVKMYLHTENEAASLKDSKLRAELKKISPSKEVKMSKAPNYFQCYHIRCFDQVPAVFDQ